MLLDLIAKSILLSRNKLALNYLLVSQEGVCALLGPQGWAFVNESQNEIYQVLARCQGKISSSLG